MRNCQTASCRVGRIEIRTLPAYPPSSCLRRATRALGIRHLIFFILPIALVCVHSQQTSRLPQGGLALGRTRYGETSAGARATPADLNRRRMQEGSSTGGASAESSGLLSSIEETP